MFLISWIFGIFKNYRGKERSFLTNTERLLTLPVVMMIIIDMMLIIIISQVVLNDTMRKSEYQFMREKYLLKILVEVWLVI